MAIRGCRHLTDDGIVVAMVWVYILRCADSSLYTGSTSDLENRLRTHNRGAGGAYTAARRPVTLEYSETHETSEDALVRERQLKGWSRAKKEALIRGDRETLKRLSTSRGR